MPSKRLEVEARRAGGGVLLRGAACVARRCVRCCGHLGARHHEDDAGVLQHLDEFGLQLKVCVAGILLQAEISTLKSAALCNGEFRGILRSLGLGRPY